MSKALYVTSMEALAGKAVVALGVLELLARTVERIAVFRPIIASSASEDPLIALLRTRYDLELGERSSYGYDYREFFQAPTASARSRLVAELIEKGAGLSAQFDFVLYIGTDFTGPAPATELALNAELAVNLAAPVLNVVSGYGRQLPALLSASAESRRLLVDAGCVVAATVLNRVSPDLMMDSRSWSADATSAPVYPLPDIPVLSALTVDEVVDALDATVLLGTGEAMQREVDGYLVGSGYLQTVLPRLQSGTLLVVSGDRTDLAMGVAALAMTPAVPAPCGVILTCGIVPGEIAMSALAAAGFPVAASDLDSAAVLHRLEGVRGEIRAGSRRKIAAALGQFALSIDADELAGRIAVTESPVVTPAMFASVLLSRARADLRTVVLPEGDDERVLRAADELCHLEAVRLVVLGDPDAVRQRAERLGLDLSNLEVVDPVSSRRRNEFAETYAQLRAHKGVTVDAAHDVMADPCYFATMLVHAGIVDGMVSGAAHTTAQTIRPALEILKTAAGVSLVSSAFFMCLPKRLLVFADCAVNPNPTAEQLAEIGASTADTAAMFGIEARVAFVSYSTGESGSGVDVEKVRTAVQLIGSRRPDLEVVGPIQYDAAVEPAVAAAKMPGNASAGRATVLIFPDLNTGNTAYKAVQRSAGGVAIGPVLQGLRRPVNDLSRGCTVDDIVDTVLITAVQAGAKGPRVF
jgi:phosphate acetyltransferase